MPIKGGADLKAAIGAGAVLATCDGAREREAAKELMNLLQQAREAIYPPSEAAPADLNTSKSMEQLLREELLNTRSSREEAPFLAINTGTKGVVVVAVRDGLCPRALVFELFDRVKRENLACSRTIVRITPFQRVCHSDEAQLTLAVAALVEAEFSPAEAPVDDSDATQPLKKQRSDAWTYCVDFKARNHETLKKTDVYDLVNAAMPSTLSVNFRQPQVPTLQSILLPYTSPLLPLVIPYTAAIATTGASMINISSAVF